MELVESKTSRGFTEVGFTDLYDTQCSIQKSSLATEDALWIGAEGADPQMHLGVDEARALLPILQRFVETGEVSTTPHVQANIAKLKAENERLRDIGVDLAGDVLVWKSRAEDAEAALEAEKAKGAARIEMAAQVAYDNGASAFRERYTVDYKGRQRWDRLQLRSAENQVMNILAEDTAAAIRALATEDQTAALSAFEKRVRDDERKKCIGEVAAAPDDEIRIYGTAYIQDRMSAGLDKPKAGEA